MSFSEEELKSFVTSIESLESQKARISEEIKDLFAEMKSRGFDVAAIKIVLKEKKMNKDKLEELESVVEVYKQALGIL